MKIRILENAILTSMVLVHAGNVTMGSADGVREIGGNRQLFFGRCEYGPGSPRGSLRREDCPVGALVDGALACHFRSRRAKACRLLAFRAPQIAGEDVGRVVHFIRVDTPRRRPKVLMVVV